LHLVPLLRGVIFVSEADLGADLDVDHSSRTTRGEYERVVSARSSSGISLSWSDTACCHAVWRQVRLVMEVFAARF
jgi:hypothetical protein